MFEDDWMPPNPSTVAVTVSSLGKGTSPGDTTSGAKATTGTTLEKALGFNALR
jgi:hypothetical protein